MVFIQDGFSLGDVIVIGVDTFHSIPEVIKIRPGNCVFRRRGIFSSLGIFSAIFFTSSGIKPLKIFSAIPARSNVSSSPTPPELLHLLTENIPRFATAGNSD
jgi:hypothetical protein